jgi:UbiD family decarboxylase
MSFRQVLNARSLETIHIHQPASRDFEISALLKRLEPRPVIFENVRALSAKVAGNIFCSKKVILDYYHLENNEFLPWFQKAISFPLPPSKTESAPCQEIILENPALDLLPILRHFESDGGAYITSGVVICKHPQYGQNMDFHRMMVFDKDKMAVRVVRGRHFDRYLSDLREIQVAVCIGVSPNVLLAAATSVEIGVDELGIANALAPLQVTKALTSDLYIPADAEFVIEGKVRLDERHPEGPFVDLTETQDIVRKEPVMTVELITHRKDPIWHALLPGGLEHKLLMGLPREPTIFRKVNQVVRCLDVSINPGGCSWLHAIVQIQKENEEDGKKAILAAFEGHSSLKHVFVVDQDIHIYDPLAVEWAMATRFQADRDLVILPKKPGSSLDPSAEGEAHLTTRAGFDLTAPLHTQGKSFQRVQFPEVDLDRWIKPNGS